MEVRLCRLQTSRSALEMFSLAHFWLGKCSLSDTCPEFHHNSGASFVMSPASASDLAHRQFPILIIGSGCACWMTETTPTPPTSPDFPLFQDRMVTSTRLWDWTARTQILAPVHPTTWERYLTPQYSISSPVKWRKWLHLFYGIFVGRQ